MWLAALAAVSTAATPSFAAPAGPDDRDPAWSRPAASVSADAQTLVRSSGESADMSIVYAVEDGGKLRIESVDVADPAEATRAVEQVQALPDVVAVDIDTTHRLADVVVGEPVREVPPKDPFRDEQWALDALQAEKSWQSSDGQGVVVAIVDSGVSRHEDLQGSFVPGRDFVHDSNERSDGNGHGTHVAGIISMTPGNNIGGAGLAPGASLMPVVVADADGSVRAADSARGIIWAVDHGADIINMSYSGTATSVEHKAIQYAHEHDVITVAAVGNSYRDGRGGVYNPVQYPAAFAGVLGIGGLTKGLERSSYSQTGKQVDLTAPGGSGAGTLRDVFSTFGRKDYLRMSGTSMATPYVSAAAALVLSRARALGVQVNVQDVLLGTSRDLGDTGRDDWYGFGLVTPAAALALVDSTANGATVVPHVEPSEVSTRLILPMRAKATRGFVRYRIPRKGKFIVSWQKARKKSWSKPRIVPGFKKGRVWHKLPTRPKQRLRIVAFRKGSISKQAPVWMSQTVRTRAASKMK